MFQSDLEQRYLGGDLTGQNKIMTDLDLVNRAKHSKMLWKIGEVRRNVFTSEGSLHLEFTTCEGDGNKIIWCLK